MRKAIAIQPVVSAIYPMITGATAPPTIVMISNEEASLVFVPASLNASEKIVGNMMLSPRYRAKNAMRDKVPLHTTTISVATKVRMSQYRSIRIRTRFQTGQSASYHKQRQNEEVETVDPASRYEHQSTDTEENQSCYHSPPVAPLPDNPSGRQRHQKVGTIDGSLRQGRHRLADMERLLEMRIQHLEDAMGKAPHEEEAADDEEGHQIVMPFVSEDGWLRHDSLQN